MIKKNKQEKPLKKTISFLSLQFQLAVFFFIMVCATLRIQGQSKLKNKFNFGNMEFAGSPMSQAKILLRQVFPYGKLGESKNLPNILNKVLSGEISTVSLEKIKIYLLNNQINQNDIGGDLNLPLCKNNAGITANYFVIHDTSFPLNSDLKDFPKNINNSNWRGNSLKNLNHPRPKIPVHVFVNRMGYSGTQTSFNLSCFATKLETNGFLGMRSHGDFIHIEMIQPRIFDSKKIDAISPNPGFTQPQLKRLALLYIVASARKKQWLIPAFHACLDEGIKNSHDDPQNFNLIDWSNEIENLIIEINSIKTTNFSPSRKINVSINAPYLESINCLGVIKKIKQEFNGGDASWSREISLPYKGKFTLEAHYVTKLDSFPNGYPSTRNEGLSKHLKRSFSNYKLFDPNISFLKLYKYNNSWTPQENGKFGQGSIGENQNKLLDTENELWMMNMMWAQGFKPKLNSKFLVSFGGRNVVVISGYETGPRDSKFLGGLTGEVHSWLKTSTESIIRIIYLKDQSVKPGPCNCQPLAGID